MTERSAADRVHALLFVADSPTTVDALREVLNLTEGQVEQALEVLNEHLSTQGPIQLVKLAGGFQLATKPEYLEEIAVFLKPARSRLSKSLVEVLAIVAYRQPITIQEIEIIRGVSSDYGLRQLIDRDLVQEVGRKQSPGRPILYGTTEHFLHQFNLNELGQLPALTDTLEPPQSNAKLPASP